MTEFYNLENSNCVKHQRFAYDAYLIISSHTSAKHTKNKNNIPGRRHHCKAYIIWTPGRRKGRDVGHSKIFGIHHYLNAVRAPCWWASLLLRFVQMNYEISRLNPHIHRVLAQGSLLEQQRNTTQRDATSRDNMMLNEDIPWAPRHLVHIKSADSVFLTEVPRGLRVVHHGS